MSDQISNDSISFRELKSTLQQLQVMGASIQGLPTPLAPFTIIKPDATSQGPTGFTGSRGFTGSKGDAGFIGSRGAIGQTGFTGSIGPVGSRGFTGSIGATGAGFAGSKGATGFTGSAGNGFTGSAGTLGFTGSQGAGYVGSTGYTGSAAGRSRITISATTGSLATNASASLNLTGFKGYALFSISTNVPAWVTVYTSNATRTSDASRAISADPAFGSGVIAETITTNSNLNTLFTPAIIGFNGEDTPTTNIPIKVVNRYSGSSAVTVTLTLIQLEF